MTLPEALNTTSSVTLAVSGKAMGRVSSIWMTSVSEAVSPAVLVTLTTKLSRTLSSPAL